MQKDLIVDFLNCKPKNFKTSLKKMAKGEILSNY